MAKQAISVALIVLLAGLLTGCATQSDLDALQSDIDRMKSDINQIKGDIKTLRSDLRLIESHNIYRKALSSLKKGVRVRNQDEIWVLVNTQSQSLSVLKGNRRVTTFKNIAIGRNGAGYKQRLGDDKTPLGEFTVGWINNKSRFRLFFGLNYPSKDYAKRGLRSGLIDRRTYQKIQRAAASGNPPPQYTPLGGMIGIHGLGRSDPFIHDRMNWTNGCIALTNKQIDHLKQWVKKGTRVVIR